MKNNKLKRFLNSYYLQLVIVMIIIVLLMTMAIVLMRDVNRGNPILSRYDLIKSIYLSAILGGAAFGYSQSAKSFDFQLSFTTTRKDIYFNTLKKVLQVTLISTILSLLYVVIDSYFGKINTPFWQIFIHEGLLMMLELVLFISLVGFFMGFIKMNSYIAYILLLLVGASIYITIDYFDNSLIACLILLASVIILGGIDFLIVKKVEVK